MTDLTSIGAATMLDDGTLVLDLRADGEDVIGDAHIEYKPTDWQYEITLAHLGGLKPGESKPVPAWPDEDDDDISDLAHEYDDLAKPRAR